MHHLIEHKRRHAGCFLRKICLKNCNRSFVVVKSFIESHIGFLSCQSESVCVNMILECLATQTSISSHINTFDVGV